MPGIISSNKTIAKNTMLLYTRMLFNLIVSLYTSRVILQVLGVENLGIYQVVAGIVVMFAFINGSLAGATSRFLTFELGRGNLENMKRVFSVTVNVHLLAAGILFIVGETIGLSLVRTHLVIPEHQESAALVVYQCALFSTMLSLFQAPFNAAIIAHEKMDVFAYIGVLDTVLKLAICYLLYLIPNGRLIAYGVMLLMCTIIIQFLYIIYCKRNFQECIFSLQMDRATARPILAFSGWDIMMNFSLAAKNQGINIILNLFCGVVINAACGFANTVYGAISGFANNFMLSVRPVITKALAIGDYNKVQELIINSSKYSFNLIILLSVPFLFEGDFIIKLWLKTPPDYTTLFCQYQLVTCIISVLFSPLAFTIKATGKNKCFSIIDSLLFLSILPTTYLLLKANYSPVVPFVLEVVVEIIKSNIYSKLLKREMPSFKIYTFYRKSVLPSILMAFAVIGSTMIVFLNFEGGGWGRFVSISATSTLMVLLLTYFYAFNDTMRKKCIEFVKTRLS